MIIEKHLVKSLSSEKRLQDYAIDIFESIQTKSALKKAIKRGQILINNRQAHTGDWIEVGQEIVLLQPESKSEKPVFKQKINVVYEDDYFAVINKIAGFPTSGNYFKTIENALPYNLKPSCLKDRLVYPQPVHRLDGPTRGLLICAKTMQAKSSLSQLFQDQKISKVYTAIVKGHFDSNDFTIQHDIDGKNAFTQIIVKHKFNKHDDAFSLLSLFPTTGRTHQLRKHLSSEGHPIVGDDLYDDCLIDKKSKSQGLYLQASGLKFKHPFTNQIIDLNLDIPKKFSKFITPNKNV